METDKYNVSDLVVSAIEQKPLDFQNILNDIMVDRAANAIDAYRMEVSQKIFNDASINHSEE